MYDNVSSVTDKRVTKAGLKGFPLFSKGKKNVQVLESENVCRLKQENFNFSFIQ